MCSGSHSVSLCSSRPISLPLTASSWPPPGSVKYLECSALTQRPEDSVHPALFGLCSARLPRKSQGGSAQLSRAPALEEQPPCLCLLC